MPYGDKYWDPKQARKINSDLNNPKTKYDGLVRLNKLLDLCDENIISDNAATWIKSLPHIILQVHDVSTTRQLAAENFSLLLSQSCQIPSVSREISSTLIPTTLTSLLQANGKDGPVVSAIYSILINYPTSCADLRSRIVKFVMSLMMSPIRNKRRNAIECWAQVPFLGGGGSQRSTHAQQWQNQLDQTIQSLKFSFRLYMGEDREDVSDPCVGSLSLPFLQLPNTEPELSDVLIQRICTLFECLQALMNVDFRAVVQIPIKSIMTTLFDVLDIIPSQLGNTSEMLHRASFIPLIQGTALQLFGKLTHICNRNLCQYSSRVNRTLYSLLDLWKDKSPVHGKNKKYNLIRTQVYTAILEWIKNCGVTCRFLCGPNHLNQIVLKHIIDDFIPMSNTLKVTNATVQTNNSKKAKKRRLNEASQELLHSSSCDRIRNPKVNLQLCTSTLKVILEAISTLGHRLFSEMHRLLQENIIIIVLKLQQGEVMDPYTRCSAPRLLLYKVLLALTLSPPLSVAPPTALVVKIFSFALSNEKIPEIKSFCTEGISSLNVVIHPWRNSWHICSSNNNESSEKQDLIKIAPIIEPMNIEHIESDIDEENDECEENGDQDLGDNVEMKERTYQNGMSEEKSETEYLKNFVHTQEAFSLEKLATKVSIAQAEDVSNNEAIGAINCDIAIENIVDDDDFVQRSEQTAKPADLQNNTRTTFHLPKVNSSGNDGINASVTVANMEECGVEDMEEVNKMLLDFVDASPDEDE
ncbi:proline-, glutamic acid- and leucine-rich protein 1-like isoform X2 [Styela clava]